ncbi:MAG: GNAT family N-acetyltransferase [Chloroflexi bacterium]|nr:GNAT family N-acetyltransferase [Chloroflexota bacterium]
MVTSRPATLDDEPRVLALLQQLLEDETPDPLRWSAGYRLIVAGDRGTALVAEDTDRVLGCITVSYNLAVRYGGEYAQIEELIVDQAARGKNVGAALVNAAIDAARARGCQEIGLYSRETTRAFYEKLGFRYAGPELRLPLKE